MSGKLLTLNEATLMEKDFDRILETDVLKVVAEVSNDKLQRMLAREVLRLRGESVDFKESA